MGEDGKPVYDQQFFLSLARRGREAWNKWRDENPKVRVTFEKVDFREPENATINFSGFTLAMWSEGNANLSGATFGNGADFSGANFGHDANFFGVTFGGSANLSGVTFGAGSNLSHATFGDSADLSGADFGPEPNLFRATFGEWTNLSGATFGDRAVLSGANFGNGATLFAATFGDRADLSNAAFGYYSNLSYATFGSQANLSHATFGDEAHLEGATFGNRTNLSGATFGNEAHLEGVTFGDRVNFVGAIFEGSVDLSAQSEHDWRKQGSRLLAQPYMRQSWTPERQQQFWDAHLNLHNAGAGPVAFRRVSFERARFSGIANFSGRNFLARCDLTRAEFLQPPTFHECKATGHIDLYGSRIKVFRKRTLPGWTTDSDVVVRLRALRKLADETGNHDLERDLYIEERKAERGIVLADHWRDGKTVLIKPRFLAHCLWIAVMGIYWLLADYGRSVIRPLLALVVSIFVFHALYSMVPTSPSTINENFRRAVWAFTIANAVPFVGALTLEKEVKGLILCAAAPLAPIEIEDSTPSCGPVPTLAFQLLVLGQSIISGLLIFFIALALRNFFRLR